MAAVAQQRIAPRIIRARVAVHFDLDLALHAFNDAQDLVIGPQRAALVFFRVHRHEIGQAQNTLGGAERGFEHVGVSNVAACGVEPSGRAQHETSPFLAVEECRKKRWTFEARPAQPVDGTGARDERDRTAVADHRVITNIGKSGFRRHDCARQE